MFAFARMELPKGLITIFLFILPVQNQLMESNTDPKHNFEFKDPLLFSMQCTYHLWRLSNQTRILTAFANILTTNYNYGLWTLRSIDTGTTTPPVDSFHEKCSINIIIYGDRDAQPNWSRMYDTLHDSMYTHRTKNHNMFIFVYIQNLEYPDYFFKVDTKIYLHPLLEQNDRFPKYFFCPWCIESVNPLTKDLSITSMDYRFINAMKKRNKDGLRQPRLAVLIYQFTDTTDKPGVRRDCPWLTYQERAPPGFCDNEESILDALSETFNFTMKNDNEKSVRPNYGYIKPYVNSDGDIIKGRINNRLYLGFNERTIIYCRPKLSANLIISFDVWASPFDNKVYIALFILFINLLLFHKLMALDCLALMTAQAITMRGGRNWLVITVSLLMTTIIASSYQNVITSKLIVPPEYTPISNLSELIRNGGKVVLMVTLDEYKNQYIPGLKLDFIKYDIEDFFPQSVVFISNESTNKSAIYDFCGSSRLKIFGFLMLISEKSIVQFSNDLASKTKTVVEKVLQPLGYYRQDSVGRSWINKNILRRIAQFQEHGFNRFWTEINVYMIEQDRIRDSKKHGSNVKDEELEWKERTSLNLSDLVSVYVAYTILMGFSFVAFLLEINFELFVYIGRERWCCKSKNKVSLLTG